MEQEHFPKVADTIAMIGNLLYSLAQEYLILSVNSHINCIVAH